GQLDLRCNFHAPEILKVLASVKNVLRIQGTSQLKCHIDRMG
ncbi:MAG: hypothetical protein ACI8W7_002307, partial [Gammaproteobacteria bacterium]